MNKEQKVWLLISAIFGIAFVGIMTMSIYDIRFKYGLYVTITTFSIMYIGFIMFALTQWIPTREIVSILAKKLKHL